VIRQIRAELLKIRSTRTTLGLVLGMVALVLLFVLLTGFLADVDGLSSKDDQLNYLGLGSLAALFAALAGVLVVTSEYRFGTIRPTIVFNPRRSQVVGAKLVASMLAGLVFGVVAVGLSYGIGRAILSGRGIPLALDGGDVAQLLLGGLAVAALWGAIGVGLAAILRNQIASVIGLIAWSLLVENLLFGLVPKVGRFTPGRASDALMGMTTDHLLSGVAGAAVLVAWAAVLAAVGIAITARRDVV
jgi:ABC-type transport system involved in multi-copper enzyme maturation permease subunit